MANVDIRLGYKDSAWFTSNATLVLLAGQSVHLLQTGTYKIGDGTTQLSALSFLGGTATSTDLVVATVVNKTNTNLLASQYRVVKVSTAQGQRLAVDFAQANNDNNSTDTIGLVRENILNNQEGKITVLGQITNINTTGSLQSETWADGDPIYLSTTIAGAVTNIKPTGLVGHLVALGYVEYAHAINGKIYVKVQNGYEINELHDVYVNPTTLANNDLLVYESSSQLWKNKAFTFIPNVQSVTSAATVTPTTLNDEVVITAQAVGLTLANPTGTAVQGQSLIIRIKDNGTARTIAYDTQYRAIGVTLPTTTIISKTLYLGLIYNLTDTKWDCIGVSQQA